MSKKNKKVLILGGSGFVGSHTCFELLKRGYKVIIYDLNINYFLQTSSQNKNILYRNNFLLKGSEIIRGNTLDISDLRRKIYKHKPNYIINFAALPLAVTAIENTEEAFKSIILCTHNVLEILRDCSFVQKYVHISSSMVYGDFYKFPNPENAPKNPKEIYGSMKLSSEYIVRGYSKMHNINSVIIRPSAVYGPTDNNFRVIQKLLSMAMTGKQIVANNPNNNFLDFTNVKDTALGITLATIKKTKNLETFNITYGKSNSLIKVLDIIKKLVGKIDVKINKDNSFYPKRGSLDIRKAKKILGYNPSYNLEKGIKEYYDYLKFIENYEG